MGTRDGNPFWAPPKRPPTPLTFTTEDPLHLDFVIATAHLWAQVYGVKDVITDTQAFKKAVSAVKVPEFKPKTNVKIKEDDKDQVQEGAEDDADAVQRIIAQLPATDWFKGRLLNSQEFEK